MVASLKFDGVSNCLKGLWDAALEGVRGTLENGSQGGQRMFSVRGLRGQKCVVWWAFVDKVWGSVLGTMSGWRLRWLRTQVLETK